MARQIYVLVGVPAAGKTWAMNQLKEKFHLVPHDEHIDKDYVDAILKAANMPGDKPLLIDTPFSISKIVDPLTLHGHQITQVFIIENPNELMRRYKNRGQLNPYPTGHITRQGTYLRRAKELKAFVGTSSEALRHLQELR